MLEFDSRGYEVYINLAWVDLTPDVMFSPAPTWSRGILDNDVLSRVGDPGILRFYLRNDEQNSAGKIGYYSPGHANMMTGWASGLIVRLWYQFEGKKYYKYRGRIQPNGLNISPGPHAKRTVMVTCGDFMDQVSEHELNLLTLQTDLRIDQVVPLILANMVAQPLNTSYATGHYTFPTVFDTIMAGTKGISEFQKLALSEFGYIYERGDDTGGSTLVVESLDTRSSVARTNLSLSASDSGFLLLEDGGYLVLEDDGYSVLSETQPAVFDNLMLPDMTRISYGKNLANRINQYSYPRRVDAAATTVLFTLQQPIQILAGETKTGVRGAYRDPNGGATYINGQNMVTPVSGTDYAAFTNEDGTGSNLTANLTVSATYGTTEVEYTLTATVDLWVTVLQARGKGIYLLDPVNNVIQDDASILSNNGVYAITFDMKYQNNPIVTQNLAEYTLGLEKTPKTTIDRAAMYANRNSMTMYGFLELEPGTRAKFIEDMNVVDGDYFIMGYEATEIAGKYVIWSPCLRAASESSFGIWDVSTWDNANWGFPA